MWTRDTTPPSPGDPLVVTERATLVLAPNANAWTFEGTNTSLLAEPGSDVCAVVDPGPDDDAHLAAILAAAGERRIVAVLVTHAHHDHAELARRLARVTGAPVRAAHPRLTDEPLQDDDEIRVGALSVRVLYTPGHTGDSVCFLLPAEGSVLTGDTVLGGGSPIVKPGRLGQFFDSLDRLSEVLAAPGSVSFPVTVRPCPTRWSRSSAGARRDCAGWTRSSAPWRRGSRTRTPSWTTSTPTCTRTCATQRGSRWRPCSCTSRPIPTPFQAEEIRAGAATHEARPRTDAGDPSVLGRHRRGRTPRPACLTCAATTSIRVRLPPVLVRRPRMGRQRRPRRCTPT